MGGEELRSFCRKHVYQKRVPSALRFAMPLGERHPPELAARL
jgi:hypothetical protein